MDSVSDFEMRIGNLKLLEELKSYIIDLFAKFTENSIKAFGAEDFVAVVFYILVLMVLGYRVFLAAKGKKPFSWNGVLSGVAVVIGTILLVLRSMAMFAWAAFFIVISVSVNDGGKLFYERISDPLFLLWFLTFLCVMAFFTYIFICIVRDFKFKNNRENKFFYFKANSMYAVAPKSLRRSYLIPAVEGVLVLHNCVLKILVQIIEDRKESFGCVVSFFEYEDIIRNIYLKRWCPEEIKPSTSLAKNEFGFKKMYFLVKQEGEIYIKIISLYEKRDSYFQLVVSMPRRHWNEELDVFRLC